MVAEAALPQLCCRAVGGDAGEASCVSADVPIQVRLHRGSNWVGVGRNGVAAGKEEGEPCLRGVDLMVMTHTES